MRIKRWIICFGIGAITLSGCARQKETEKKVVIEVVQYKREAVKVFEELEEKFNATHDDIELKIQSPNDAMTILKTRFIREDAPDIIGIGGDINYSQFLDADMLMDISDFQGLNDTKEAYLKIDKELEFIPKEGIYALPYAANAAGVLYNRTMFEENGWTIPETWTEFNQLCKKIEDSGMQPLVFGMKDAWTCLAPWNALAVGLAPSDVCSQVNQGKTTFANEYKTIAQYQKEILKYGQSDPYAYGYNDACTAFAKGQSAMFTIGSYAVPQIKSVNPQMDIDSFVFPANEDPAKNVLNSGVDLQFSIMKECENKEAAYEVLKYLYEDENLKLYLDEQNAVPCKEGDFLLAPMLDGMEPYIQEGRMADYQDHHYPSEMSVDAMIQTYQMDEGNDAQTVFLEKFDKEWRRYNRDLISKVQKYQKKHPEAFESEERGR